MYGNRQVWRARNVHYLRDELERNGLPHSVLRGARNVPREPPAVAATERYLRARRWGAVRRIALDGAGTGRTAEWAPAAITGDQMKRLRRVVRVRTWLSHSPSR